MEHTQVNLSQRSDNKESFYNVRNNIWPKSTALPYLEDFLSTSQWSIYTLEEQTLTKSKFVPRDEREQGSTFTMEKLWIGLRIFSKSHTYNTMEATSLGEQTLTKSKFAPPSHSCSGAPCSNLEIFLSTITSEDMHSWGANFDQVKVRPKRWERTGEQLHYGALVGVFT